MLRIAHTTTRRNLILTDAGPLAALVLPNDQGHSSCVFALRQMKQNMVTTWPAFAEAMFLAGKVRGWPAQELLWKYVSQGALLLANAGDTDRVAELMAKYRSVPMDLADATLIALAEDEGHRRVFTLDSDFYVYRLENGRGLEVLP